MDVAPKTSYRAPITVAFLLFDGFQPIDLAGPWQTFTTANEELGRETYRLVTIGTTQAVRSADGALQIATERMLADSLEIEPDIVVVPGGPGVHTAAHDLQLLQWLRDTDAVSQRTCSICTGAFLLAAAGLLKGRQAATHWRSAARLQREHPAVRVDDDRIFCESGKYWTSAGVTAGIDLALALVERDCGASIAQRVARRLVVYLRRDGGQRQYSQTLRIQDQANAPFNALVQQMERRLHEDWTVDAMAEACNMSRRTFQRKFAECFGMGPMVALRRMRLERATILAAPGRLSGKAVARWTRT